ncbi:hypothetical protein EVAR_9724_1 [Eumeta japonica]|uniref:Uncharacterized protein n=1 Tax=Eumeta variegata TaxID=151549 RepID=A0A4C1U5E1_EUMVA|nr:hypothetical protein EVAR_9724_1 [Eumeta japonica]
MSSSYGEFRGDISSKLTAADRGQCVLARGGRAVGGLRCGGDQGGDSLAVWELSQRCKRLQCGGGGRGGPDTITAVPSLHTYLFFNKNAAIGADGSAETGEKRFVPSRPAPAPPRPGAARSPPHLDTESA